MEFCPTCGAKFKGDSTCHRCKTDLSVLLKIEQEANSLLVLAKQSLQAREYNQALQQVKKSLFLLRTNEAESLEAFIYAITGDFRAYNKLRAAN